MADDFDPYFKWLGILPEEQPPNHYRLLGIPNFVADGDVISNAADRQMSHLRTYQVGRRSELSQRLLNEVSAAKLCLLNAHRKAAYDAQLRAELGSQQPKVEQPATRQQPAPARPLTVPQSAGPIASPLQRHMSTTKRQRPAWQLPALVGAMVVVVLVVGLIFLLSGSEESPTVAQRDAPPPVHTPQAAPSPSPPAAEPPRTPLAPKPAAPSASPTPVTPPATTPPPATGPSAAQPVVPPSAAANPVVPAPSATTPSAASGIPQPAAETTQTVTVELPNAASNDPVANGPPAPPLAKAPFNIKQAHEHQQAWARYLGIPVESTNSIGMRMVLIPPGEFLMGSSDDSLEETLKIAEIIKAEASTLGGLKSTRPQHRVVITKPFLLGATEVTIKQFKQFTATGYRTEREQLGPNEAKVNFASPGYAAGDQFPAALVSWNDAAAFCNWLSSKEDLDEGYAGPDLLPGNGYRLPSEAQWEYACRAGSTGQFCFGDDFRKLDQFAWSGSNGGKPHAVATLKENPFGLFDMHGNVFELCQDWYSPYAASPVVDPTGPATGTVRVHRGGTAWFSPSTCFTVFRSSITPNVGIGQIGFRVSRQLDLVPKQKPALAADVGPANEGIDKPAPTKPTKPKIGEPIDLLAEVDVKRDVLNFDWTKENGELISPARIDGRIQLGRIPAADYQVALEVRRESGDEGLMLWLPVGTSNVIACIDQHHSKHSGLTKVDNRHLENNPTVQNGAVLKGSDVYSVVYTVRGNRILCAVNGKPLFDLSGDFNRLSVDGYGTLPDRQRLILASHSRFRFTKITVTPLTLRPPG